MVFPGAKLLIVVREQISMILSTYKQYVREGGTSSIQKYIDRKRDVRFPTFRLDYFCYDKLVAKYRSLYPKENILILPYELLKIDARSFVNRIRVHCGLGPSSEAFDDKRLVNEAERGLTISFMRRWNPFVRSDSTNGFSSMRVKGLWRVEPAVVGIINQWLPSSWHKSVDEARRRKIIDLVGSRYSDSNFALSNLMGIDLAKFGYDVSQSTPAASEQRMPAAPGDAVPEQ
jgi:hypothetical protein